MAIKIFYPSGINATVNAKFVKAAPLGKEFVVAFELTDDSEIKGKSLNKGEMLIVDPRAVCIDSISGQVLYNGRDHYRNLSANFRQWLDEHREWPNLLELGGSN